MAFLKCCSPGVGRGWAYKTDMCHEMVVVRCSMRRRPFHGTALQGAFVISRPSLFSCECFSFRGQPRRRPCRRVNMFVCAKALHRGEMRIKPASLKKRAQVDSIVAIGGCGYAGSIWLCVSRATRAAIALASRLRTSRSGPSSMILHLASVPE